MVKAWTCQRYAVPEMVLGCLIVFNRDTLAENSQGSAGIVTWKECTGRCVDRDFRTVDRVAEGITCLFPSEL